MERYFVKWSSVHDYPPYYRYEEYKRVLEEAGATTFAYRLNNWSNQPQVVGFTGITKKQAEEALMSLDEFKAWGPIIHPTKK